MAKKGSVEVAWHPNFADSSALPDIKVVRSAFFINFTSLLLVAVMLFYWGFLEFQISTVSGLIAEDNKQIKFLAPGNVELLKQSQEFERWARLINEVQGFLSSALKPSGFLLAMGEARPSNMTMSELRYNIEARSDSTKDAKGKKTTQNYAVYTISLAGSVSGTSQQATRAVEAFRDSLSGLPIFKEIKVVKPPFLKSFVRDSSLDVYSFVITLEVRP